MNLLFFFSLLMICFNTEAYAYLDPGTGSSILQLIIGLLAGLGTFLSLYWTKFKYFVRKIFKKSNLDDNKK